MTSRSSKRTKAFLGVALALTGMVAACASQGPTDDPIARKLQWFSYLEGGDLRAACGPDAPARYRLVYNGVYAEQVRTYDLDSGGVLGVRVIEPANLRDVEVRFEKPADLLGPWRGKGASRVLSADQTAALVAALDRDGAFGPPAVGTELSSRGFFWTIAACHEGRYHFTGLTWPSPAWDAATFGDALFALDPSPIDVNPPRKTVTTRILKPGPAKDDEVEFHAKVGERGLFGLSDLLR